MGQKGVKFSKDRADKSAPQSLDEAAAHQNDWERAAAAILDADFLIIGAGAGFSADAGLAVYKDIANFEAYAKMGVEYSDLCDPEWLEKDPEIFYGFWGTCYNDYKNTAPHEGYKILYKWRHRLFKPRSFPVNGDIKEQKELRRMHIYTSNVDRMFYKAGFKLDEIEEIHGNAVIMQCAKPCAEHVWELDSQFRYHVEKQTMRAPAVKVQDVHDNHPSCPQCKGPARPNVLMFGDMYYFEAAPANPDYNYKKFATDVENVLRANKGAKLVVLEMGAGKRVPSIRNHCQRWINDATLGDFAVTLIRINPDFPDLDPLAWHPSNSNKTHKWFNFISFKAGALDTLKRIHEEMVKLVRAVDDSIDVESEDDSAATPQSISSSQALDVSESSSA